jgi:hypothetical protein
MKDDGEEASIVQRAARAFAEREARKAGMIDCG